MIASQQKNKLQKHGTGGTVMEWISVNTNGRYAVNRAGEVKNLETNKKLKPSFNKAGYLVVSLYDGQTHKRRTGVYDENEEE